MKPLTMRGKWCPSILLQSEWAAFGNAVRHPVDSALGALPTLIVPLASVLLSSLRKSKKDDSKE